MERVTPHDVAVDVEGLDTVAGAWLMSLAADTTRAAYRDDLRRWLAWCTAHDVHPLTAGRAAVDTWLDTMKREGLAPSTRARRLAAVRSFYRYAVDVEVVRNDPTERVRPPKVSPDPVKVGLTLPEVRRVVNAAVECGPSHRATVGLLLGAALRVSEAVAATVADIHPVDGHTVLDVVGKGGRRRVVPLSAFTLELLDPMLPWGPLIVGRDGAHVDRYAAAHMVRRVGRAAALDRPISPHILRHTAATLALDGGAPVQTVADLLGHSSPTTTMRYVAGRERLRDSAAYVLAGALAGGG